VRIRNTTIGNQRSGIATVWAIVAVPVLLVAMCFAVESARLWLMRQQLIVSLESAALGAVKRCDDDAGIVGTSNSRRTAVELASVNTVDGNPVPLALNLNAADVPNENASCGGDIVFGTILERAGGMTFNAGLPGGCGDETSGPKAVTFQRTSINDWQTVTFCDRSYACMVVVGTPNYTVATSPSVVRIQNVTATSFEFFVQNVNTLAPTPGIPVHFLVVEAGTYTAAADGVTMEAVKYNSTVTDRAFVTWNGEIRPYLNAYANPVVVGQVMTYNDPRWSVFWSRGNARTNPNSATDLRTGKHIGEDPDITRADETVGYIVIESGSGSIDGLPYYAQQGPDTVVGMGNGAPVTYGLPGAPFVPGGFAVASQSAMDGNNGSWAVLHGTDPVGDTFLNLGVDEDQNRDADRNHTTENVNYIVLAGPCAVRVQTEMTVDYMCTFGCELTPPTLQGHVYSYFDCVKHRPRLTKVDAFVCPGP
jgi:hypothetical protein